MAEGYKPRFEVRLEVIDNQNRQTYYSTQAVDNGPYDRRILGQLLSYMAFQMEKEVPGGV